MEGARLTDSSRLLYLLDQLYGKSRADFLLRSLNILSDEYRQKIPARDAAKTALTARDAMLIVYGDQLRDADQPPLRTLTEFCR
jgi:hypothetical protein